MSGEIVKRGTRPVVLRPQVGLMLSIGEPPKPGRNYPQKLDHFRPKPGTEGQYAPAVAKFDEVYGEAPKVLDVVLISNGIGDVLDIRLKAWGTSGLRAIGQTNYALEPDRMLAFDDELTAFPENQPEAVSYQLDGPDDAIIAKVGLKLYGVLRFALPSVTGLTTLAEISTTSKRSMLNLLAGLTQLHGLTGGQIAGIPLTLAVRPARTRYFDAKENKRKTSTFYELVLNAAHTIDEFFAQVQLRRAQMGTAPQLALPPVRHDDAERDRELSPSLWRSAEEQEIEDAVGDLPLPADEDVRTREEPSAGPSDAQLNRIAALELEVGDGAGTLLYGAFSAESASQLTEATAAQYETSLQRLVDLKAEPVTDAEYVDPGPEDGAEEMFPVPASARERS